MFKHNLNKVILGATLLPSLITINTNASAATLEEVTTVQISSRANTAVEAAVALAEGTTTKANIAAARTLVNQMAEGVDKNNFQKRLDALTQVTDHTLSKLTSSASVDVYIVCENLLSLSLSTNSIVFDNFGGTEDLVQTNAVSLTVNSSLPYDVNAYLATDIVDTTGQTMDKEVLGIKANSDGGAYKKFTQVGTTPDCKVTLLSNQAKGNGVNHGIDVKLFGGRASNASSYKTVVKFEVTQK